MIFKEFKGTTPKYAATLYDEDGNVINPSSGFSKVIIKIYNNITNDLLIGYTSETPIPDDLDDYYNCTLSSTQIKFAIPAVITEEAPKGENRVEFWLYSVDSEIPDELVAVECFTLTLNEFIDSQYPD